MRSPATGACIEKIPVRQEGVQTARMYSGEGFLGCCWSLCCFRLVWRCRRILSKTLRGDVFGRRNSGGCGRERKKGGAVLSVPNYLL